MQYREENNYPKAFLFSTAVLVLFLVLSYLIVFAMAKPNEEIGTGGIVVNYGTAEVGMGDDFMSIEEPSVAPNANNTPPDKVTPDQEPQETPTAEASDKAVVTQEAEDAPVVTTSKKTVSTTPSTSPETKPSKPVVNENALYKGKKSNGNGGGDGTGNTPGNQGDPDGDPLSPNYGRGGSGFGNTRLELSGRQFVNLPQIHDEGQSSGKIVVEIRVDPTGQVKYARAGVRGTTLSERNLWKNASRLYSGRGSTNLNQLPMYKSEGWFLILR